MAPRSGVYKNELPLREIVTSKIRAQIFSGALTPGTRLIERDLADEFDVSRFPIREAVRMLTQEGLVESLPTRGTVVKAMGQREVQEIFDVREALESLAARLAAERVAGGEASNLGEYVLQAHKALAVGDREAVTRANAEFHDEMIRFAGSTVLQDALLPLVGRLHWLFRQVPDLESVCADHEALRSAIDEGNPKLAVIEATRHVLHYRALTQQYLFTPSP